MRGSLARLVGLALVLVVGTLGPASARAQCDADTVRAVVSVSGTRLAQLLRAHRETDEPERWRIGAVTVYEPVIAPVLADGCHAALVEYGWTITSRDAVAHEEWRHGIAVIAVDHGHLRVVARRAVAVAGGLEPSHSISFQRDPAPVIVVSMGGGRNGTGWGSEQRFRLRGRRLVPIDTIGVGTIAR